MNQASLDNAACGYFSFSDQGTLLYVNSTLCNLLGYDTDELTGKNVESIFTLPTKIFYQTHFFPLLKLKGVADEIFIFLLAKDGTYVPVLLNAKRTGDREAINSCAFIVVVNRKKFEDELIAAKKAAEKSLAENQELKETRSMLQERTIHLDGQINLVHKKNNELKQINHAATHTLKESVRKIHLYAQRMDEVNSDMGLKKHLTSLLQASAKMKGAITSLQQYIWLSEISAEFEEVNLNKLIDTLRSKINEENNELVLNINCESLPAIIADSRQISILFETLFSNAVKFRKGNKSEITITGSLIKKNSFRHVQDKYNYEGYLKINVKDNGVGFDSVYKEEVFDLFRKFHLGEGNGVGLAICKKIVENHFGSISVESKINEYTMFEIILPAKMSAFL